MNIVLKKTQPLEYFISCIKKNGEFWVYGKYVSPDGKLRELSKNGPFSTQEEAVKRCRGLAKTKVRKKGFVELSLDEFPESVLTHMEIPPDMQISPEEMLQKIKEARRERYVVFGNVLGMEEYFDTGVEYLALTTEEPGVLSVFDRFGEQRSCFKDRMSSIVDTEDAKKVGTLKKL